MVQEISNGLANLVEYIPEMDKTRGESLEELLTDVCITLGEVGILTEQKADVGFLLTIVASYLLSREKGTLAEDAKAPSVLFDENVFPALDAYDEISVEVVEEDKDNGE